MKFLKSFIFIASIIFLVYIVNLSFKEIKDSIVFVRKNIFLELISLSVLYAFFLYFVALSWYYILRQLSQKNISFQLVWIWLQSNIYRYIPGNIFHYASRQFIANKNGITHANLIKSNFIEGFLIVLTSFLFSSIILSMISDMKVDEYNFVIDDVYIYFGIFLSFGISLYVWLYRGVKFTEYFISISLYLFFFLGLGFISYIVINYQMNIGLSYLLITAIYTISWLVGFVTPGAPGGIGVRESVFIFFTNNLLSSADVIILVAILRMISLLGEGILFLLAHYILKRK